MITISTNMHRQKNYMVRHPTNTPNIDILSFTQEFGEITVILVYNPQTKT